MLGALLTGFSVLGSAMTAGATVTDVGDAIFPGNGADEPGPSAAWAEDGVSPPNARNGVGADPAHAGSTSLFSHAGNDNELAPPSGSAGTGVPDYILFAFAVDPTVVPRFQQSPASSSPIATSSSVSRAALIALLLLLGVGVILWRARWQRVRSGEWRESVRTVTGDRFASDVKSVAR